MAELAVRGSFHERDLHDDLWLDPVDAEARQVGCYREWRCRPKDRVEPLAKRQQHLRVETGTDLAGEYEPGIRVVVTDEQGAEADPLACGIGEPADDELLARFDLHLEPAARPAVLVRRVAALGDHALPSFLARELPWDVSVDRRDARQGRKQRQRREL